MATRSRSVFVTLPEFALWLREAAEKLDLSAVLYKGPEAPLEHWDSSEEALVAASRVYLADEKPDLATVSPSDLAPGQRGWLQIDVPRIEGQCLLASMIAAKSDWFDSTEQRVLERPTSLQLFDRFWRSWKKHFVFPIWAKNTKTGAKAPYRDIGYSSAAAEWHGRGGRLCQEGVANIEFEIAPEAAE